MEGLDSLAPGAAVSAGLKTIAPWVSRKQQRRLIGRLLNYVCCHLNSSVVRLFPPAVFPCAVLSIIQIPAQAFYRAPLQPSPTVSDSENDAGSQAVGLMASWCRAHEQDPTDYGPCGIDE
jgi:hypothetical protein